MFCESVRKEEEVLTGATEFQLECEADYLFSEVLAFNWIYNGTFIHPSLNPGLTVTTNGDLNFEEIFSTHNGKRHRNYVHRYQLLLQVCISVMCSLLMELFYLMRQN